jgi:hypothetical protein
MSIVLQALHHRRQQLNRQQTQTNNLKILVQINHQNLNFRICLKQSNE